MPDFDNDFKLIENFNNYMNTPYNLIGNDLLTTDQSS